MSLWIKGEEDHSGSHERVWSKAGGWSNANDGFGIQFNPNRWDHPYFRIQVGSDASEVTTPEATIPLGEWVHLVATVNRETSIKLYVNGELSATYDDSGLAGQELNSEMPMTFGCVAPDGNEGELFVGSVDNAGLWSRELTAEEVASLHNDGVGVSYGSGDGRHYEANNGEDSNPSPGGLEGE